MRVRCFSVAISVAMLAAVAAVPARAACSRAWHGTHRHRVHRVAHGAYHIPYDPAQVEAEVHAQYRYRTPYLPYWVVP